MADLYRKTSLERLSNPDQLDKRVVISSPLSWLALIAVFLIIAATVVWAFAGSIPTTETVSGIITDKNSSYAVYSNVSGSIESYSKTPGDKVEKGDVIARVLLADGSSSSVVADISGVLGAVSAQPDTPVYAGTEIARITPSVTKNQLVVCYVPLATAQKYKPGMSVQVFPSHIDYQQYGHMQADIICVEKYASNVSALTQVVGSDNLIAEQFVANGPVVAVLCELYTDSATASGYYWTHSNGKNLTVADSTVVSAKIVIDECAPVTKLIGSAS